MDCNIFKTDIKKTKLKNCNISSISLINLKPDVTFEILDKDALNQTDDTAAEQLQYGDLISKTPLSMTSSRMNEIYLDNVEYTRYFLFFFYIVQ